MLLIAYIGVSAFGVDRGFRGRSSKFSLLPRHHGQGENAVAERQGMWLKGFLGVPLKGIIGVPLRVL